LRRSLRARRLLAVGRVGGLHDDPSMTAAARAAGC